MKVAGKNRHAFSLRKKLAFTAVTFLLLAAPGWLLLEIAYRVVYSIPLMGGAAGVDDAALADPLATGLRRSDNPILFYEPTPGATTEFYSFNSGGFRDREYSPAKDPSAFRIAVLGDSIVFGHGLDLQATFSKQLESALNELSDRRFEVLNFGVSGYSTQQEVELYRVKVSQYDPDLVIVGYCLNDFEESSAEGEAFKRFSYGLFSKSYLYDHLQRVLAGVSYNQFGYMADAPAAQIDLREQFRLLQSYCDDKRNLVVVFPILENFDDYLYAVEHRRIADALDGLNFGLLDLLDFYRGFDAESLILNPSDRTHPNALGTRLAALATAEALARQQLAPIDPNSIDLDSITTSAVELAQQDPVAIAAKIDALRIEASEHASQGRFAEAAEIAIRLSTLGVPDPAAERIRAFDWHLRAGDPDAAEADLRRAIELDANDPRVHRNLAQLLNAQGRRYEAQHHVLALARSGAITPRELLSLIDLGGPFQLVSFDQIVADRSGTLFQLGSARHQYIAEENVDAALETLDRLVSTTSSPAVEALRGRLIAEKMDDDRFRAWIENLPEGIETHPEFWLAIGLWLRQNDRDREAVRAFGEALRLDPTDRRSLRSLAASLVRIGENEKAKQAQETLAILDSVFRLAATANPEQAMWIAEQLQSLTRPWESVAWYRYAFQMQGTIESRADQLNQRVRQIVAWEDAAGTEKIRDARVAKMLGFDFRQFPMPEIASSITSRSDPQPGPADDDLRFHDIAQSVGVTTSFISEYPTDKVDFYLYQANGGGLAALDYDLDGRCDLYVVQSGGDPNQPGSSAANELYRQLPEMIFGNVSGNSQTADRGYGQGVCAGDVNQDGFPDLLVANIGRNVVYINQGDGTFRERSEIIDDAKRWTSSLAIGDLDGDQLPEIVEVNYLDDPLIFELKCEGKRLNCTPQRFRAATDRIFRSAGDGTFRLWDGAEKIGELPNYGFGAVIANFDSQLGNDLFISNDGDVNHFWRSTSASDGSAQQPYRLNEAAGISGCSIGTSGISQACMGIASGDFDRNGWLDLLITNFHNEPVNLFLQNESGFFVDEALKYGLSPASVDMLGFGTQAADFDNDGWLDLAVGNGHIYDAGYAGIPFRMVSQLFRGSRRGFSLQDAAAAGAYFSREHLARTLALADWNRDGRIDIVANHLDQPIAILQNDSQSANWLQLELVGVTSERTAIGARVVVHAAGEQWSGWQTGGDGYMCTNEPLIHFGVGSAEVMEKVEIHWPSGNVQTIDSIQPNQRYLIVEGQAAMSRGD